MRKPCMAFILALLLLALALPMAALAETRFAVDYLGRDVIVPDGWSMSGARIDSDAGEDEADYSFFYEGAGDASVKKTVLILHDFGGTDARVYIPLTYDKEEWVTSSAKDFGLETVTAVTPFTYWTEGLQVSGNVATGTVDGKPWVWMSLRFPSAYDSIVRVFYFAPADGSVDTSWFLGVIEAQFPEIARLELIPQSTAADAPKDTPEATPEPTPVPTPEPTIADFTPQEVIAFTPPDFGKFFADDSEKTYLKLGEAYGLPLAPLTEWAKVYGLAEPKSIKNGLSFAVAKGRGPEWNGLKKVDVTVPADAWVNKKSLWISSDGMRAIASALSDAWTGPKPESAPAPDPHELAQLFASSVEEAYIKLGETYGLPLAPLTEWLKVKGLSAPKTLKDGSLSFAVAKGRGGEWNGLKKVDVPVPADERINQKGMRLSLDGLRAVVAALSDAWTEPKAVPTATPKAGKGGAALMTTPFMTEEQIKSTILNYEWEYLTTYITPEFEEQSASDERHRNVIRQYLGGYYDESDSLYSGQRSFYTYYYPFDKDYSYRFDLKYDSADDFTAYVRLLSPEEIKDRAQEHLLAREIRWTVDSITMDKITVVERGVDVAGRSTTRYSSGTYYGQYIDFWVDDEYGLLLKYATIRPSNGNIATFETTKLTFGSVTPDNVIDTARFPLPLVDASMMWQYEVKDGEATITKLLADYEFKGDVAIPAEIDGYPVTAIGEDAFNWREGIASITIPDSVTAIGASAFSGCSGLTELILPPSLTHIGDYAFSSCERITKLSIPAGLMSIGEGAFSECTDLNELTLLSGLTSIGDYAFSNCERLTTLAIPPTVTFIGEYAFGHDDHIFLTAEEGSFAAQYIALRDAGWRISHTPSGLQITGYKGDELSGEVSIPSGVTSIGESAFAGCRNITGVSLPDGLISIDKYAFAWCYGLTHITIPPSVVAIGQGAFESCDSVVITVMNADGTSLEYTKDTIRLAKAIRYPLGEQNGVCELLLSPDPNGDGLIITGYAETGEGAGLHGDLSLPGEVNGKAVTGIEEDAFRNCGGLTSVTIPDSVTSIASGAFAGCYNLGTLLIPPGVTYIGTNPFMACDLLELAVSPDNPAYEVVGGVLFDKRQKILVSYPCMREGAYIVPEGTLQIGDEAFIFCEGLTGIMFPKSLTDIGDQAFSGCFGLTDVLIPNGVQNIGNYTFSNCRELVSATIPDSVRFIASGPFENCDKLTITVKKDSYAEEYAKENQVRYTLAK